MGECSRCGLEKADDELVHYEMDFEGVEGALCGECFGEWRLFEHVGEARWSAEQAQRYVDSALEHIREVRIFYASPLGKMFPIVGKMAMEAEIATRALLHELEQQAETTERVEADIRRGADDE